jgi:transcriptional regulator with GAF, ATPase, and Fis domain
LKNQGKEMNRLESNHFLDFSEQFETLITSCQIVPYGVAILDRNLRYLHANSVMAEINGESTEIVGRSVHEVNPSIAHILEPLIRRALERETDLINIETGGEPLQDGESIPNHWLISCFPLKIEHAPVQGVAIVIKDITVQQFMKFQGKRLKFEALLSSLSATFINVPISEVDSKIEQGLQKIVDFLGFDRSTIWRFLPGDEWRLVRTHSYSLPGIKEPPAELDRSMIPVWGEMVLRRKTFRVSDVDELPESHFKEKQYCRKHGGIKSMLFMPVSVSGRIEGLISFVSYRVNRNWPDDLIQRLRVLWEIFANALERKHADQKIHHALSEIERLKDRLEAENIYLRDQIKIQHTYEDILGQSGGIKEVLQQVGQVATTDSTVLIQGETGTGKELIAKAIHDTSGRKSRSMIKVNCAALPSTLIEGELFGREKGAYTGALTAQAGRFEVADGSTIFLDEIGELPLELQAKLLRILQDGKLERLGSSKQISVDVRIIAATNRNLMQAVREGSFREDLYYRLNVFPISVPPLRERREDIPLLTWAFVSEFRKVFGKHIESIPKKNMEALERYDWPGNIRELRNLIERSMILNNSSKLVVELPNLSTTKTTLMNSLKEVERIHILAVLEKTGCRIRGENGAAKILGIKPTTLEAMMKRLGIQRKAVATSG